MLKRWVFAATLAAGLMFASEARGACTISAASVNFGAYNVFNAAPLDSTGTVTCQCANNDRDVQVFLSAGQSGSYFPRTMGKGSESLPYNLFTDAARTSIWGDGSGGTVAYFNNRPRTQVFVLTIYGRIYSGADVSSGSYSDSVVATINF
jgi:spore coat protein U-like protein